MSQFKVGDVVEYKAVDPEYEYLNGHTGIVEAVYVLTNHEEYTVAWLTDMPSEVRAVERAAEGWRPAVLRKVAQLSVRGPDVLV